MSGEVQMRRPEWEAFSRSITGALLCGCSLVLWDRGTTREHWQRGHFDYVENPAPAATPRHVALWETA